MRCDYSYTLAKWQCHSIYKTPTLRFRIGIEDIEPIEVVDCCPVCANILEAELKKNGERYEIVPIQKAGEDSAVPTTRP
jgi:hypothetical protein